MTLQKLIIIIGPTASGKSELAVKIAKTIDGAVISADSRQVYRGMNIGTGKIAGRLNLKRQYIYKGVVHYGIDVANPKRQYSVAQFQKYAKRAIEHITHQGLVPIICGGTAHWIDAVVFNQTIPTIKPNGKLRRSLEKLPLPQMFAQLQKLDPDRAAEIDRHNPRRLIRALEIVMMSGKPVPKISESSPYDCIWLGINPSQEILHNKIKKRLNQRLKKGMLNEVKILRRQGLSWQRLESFGLEYRFCALYLQKKLTYPQMIDQLFTAIQQYTKRQMTWWKRNKRIRWASNPSLLTLNEEMISDRKKKRKNADNILPPFSF